MLGRQKHIRAKTLVTEPSALEFEVAVEKLNRYISPGTDQISVELITDTGRTNALRSINLLILFGFRRRCLRSGRSRSFYPSMRTVIKQIQ